MSQKSQPPKARQTNNGSNDARGINLTRRNAIMAAAAAGLTLSATAPTASAETINVSLTDFADGQDIHEQYADGEISDFSIGNSIEIDIDLSGVSDDTLYLEAFLSVNNSTEERFLQDSKTITSSNATITFDAPSIWDESNAPASFDPNADDYDLQWLSIVDSGYDNLNTPHLKADVDSDGDLTQQTDITMRFEAFTDGTDAFYEETTMSFNMNIGHVMGFGHFFGSTFGEIHVESWDGNYNR